MSACRLKIAALGLLVALSGCRTVPVSGAPHQLCPVPRPCPIPRPRRAHPALQRQRQRPLRPRRRKLRLWQSMRGRPRRLLCRPALCHRRCPRVCPQHPHRDPRGRGRSRRPAQRCQPRRHCRRRRGRADRRAESEQEPVAVASVLGRKVEDSHGDDVGRVVDVLADADGRVRLAIIEYGGFLGVGNRRVAIDWSLLRFATGEDRPVSLSVSQETLQQAPEYKTSPRPHGAHRAARKARSDPMNALGSAVRPAVAGRRHSRSRRTSQRARDAASIGSTCSSPTFKPASVRSSPSTWSRRDGPKPRSDLR